MPRISRRLAPLLPASSRSASRCGQHTHDTNTRRHPAQTLHAQQLVHELVVHVVQIAGVERGQTRRALGELEHARARHAQTVGDLELAQRARQVLGEPPQRRVRHIRVVAQIEALQLGVDGQQLERRVRQIGAPAQIERAQAFALVQDERERAVVGVARVQVELDQAGGEHVQVVAVAGLQAGERQTWRAGQIGHHGLVQRGREFGRARGAGVEGAREVRSVGGEEVDQVRVVHAHAVVDDECAQVAQFVDALEALASE